MDTARIAPSLIRTIEDSGDPVDINTTTNAFSEEDENDEELQTVTEVNTNTSSLSNGEKKYYKLLTAVDDNGYRYYRKDLDNNTPLHIYIKKGDLNGVKTFIERTELTKFILEKTEMRNEFFTTNESEGGHMTPFDLICHSCYNVNVMKYFIEKLGYNKIDLFQNKAYEENFHIARNQLKKKNDNSFLSLIKIMNLTKYDIFNARFSNGDIMFGTSKNGFFPRFEDNERDYQIVLQLDLNQKEIISLIPPGTFYEKDCNGYFQACSFDEKRANLIEYIREKDKRYRKEDNNIIEALSLSLNKCGFPPLTNDLFRPYIARKTTLV